MTFEEFLRKAVAMNGEIRLVPRVTEDGDCLFYAHVNGQNSDTVDYRVAADDLYNLKG